MENTRYVYPAVFKKKGDGYFVDFPDVKSCSTAAPSLREAVIIAKDVLEYSIKGLLEKGDALPEPSDIDSLNGDRVMLIVAEYKADSAKEEYNEEAGLDEETAEVEILDRAETLKKDGADTLADEKEKYLRLMAEYDNFRKRSFQDKENAAADAVSKVVTEMLSVTDNFARALSAECSDPNYKKGVEMIYTMFKESLGRMGIEEVEALGKPFDPNFHEAVTQIQNEKFGENTVCEVFQTGYTFGGRLIRCAMVAVANP
ncbi:MAG: nucleotide exchange factor GrpE [Oscillospiraceae bacterium]|nr:nucleotide exchange factor GrpE [Oscillospiraceae bacterium]